MRMTWKQFKDYVDEEIREKQLSEEINIGYIDISFPCDDHESCKPTVFLCDNEELAIH